MEITVWRSVAASPTECGDEAWHLLHDDSPQAPSASLSTYPRGWNEGRVEQRGDRAARLSYNTYVKYWRKTWMRIVGFKECISIVWTGHVFKFGINAKICFKIFPSLPLNSNPLHNRHTLTHLQWDNVENYCPDLNQYHWCLIRLLRNRD